MATLPPLRKALYQQREAMRRQVEALEAALKSPARQVLMIASGISLHDVYAYL